MQVNDLANRGGELYDREELVWKWSRVCSQVLNKELSLKCFQSAWVDIVLGENGLDVKHLPGQASVFPVLQVNGVGVSWQLGAALLHLNMDSITPDVPIPSRFNRISVYIGCAIVILLLVWLRKKSQMQRITVRQRRADEADEFELDRLI